ncbi:MAG: glutamine synthetase [Clostridia bacterium]|nr:glutamine synthetase [Clostridia bacterium]
MNDFGDFAAFIKEGDVKFIRLSFLDLSGRQKNVSVMADGYEEWLSKGVVIEGKGAGFPSEAEIRLVPDMDTVHILPWRPQHGRVARFLSSLKSVSGEPLAFDTRKVLSDTVAFLKEQGYTSELGTDSEFYLFQLDEAGEPTLVTQDKAGAYDIAPLDRGENVRREICLTMEEIGIAPLSSHHEQGPGQNEITFVGRPPLEACDNYVIFKSVVKAIASRNGLYASFMPKPLFDEHGNGLTVNFDIKKDKRSIFSDEGEKATAEAFVAGVQRRAKECAIFAQSVPNSYDRLAAYKQITSIALSEKRDSFMRYTNKHGAVKLALRSPDNAANLYLTVALALRAGVEGIKDGLTLQKTKESDLALKQDELTLSMESAVAEAEKSDFLKDALGETLLSAYLKEKRKALEESRKDKAAYAKKEFARL